MKKAESNKEYHASAALNKSRLHRFSVSPQWFKYCEDHPEEDSEALIVGGAFHKLVLEPDGFDNEYVVAQGIDRRTTAGKVAWAELLDSGKVKVTDTMSVMSVIFNTKNELLADANALFAGGELAEEDKDALMFALQQSYIDAKRKNKKYAHKKSEDEE